MGEARGARRCPHRLPGRARCCVVCGGVAVGVWAWCCCGAHKVTRGRWFRAAQQALPLGCVILVLLCLAAALRSGIR